MGIRRVEWSGGVSASFPLRLRRDANGSVGTSPYLFLPTREGTEKRQVVAILTSEGRLAELRWPTGDGPAVHPYRSAAISSKVLRKQVASV